MPRKVKTVKVYAKKPGMQITIDGTVHPFENGVLEVSQELAEQVRRHHLYRRDHIFFEEDAVVVEGRVQSMKNDPKLEEMKTAKKGDSDLIFFQFPARPNAVVDAGPYNIRFEGGQVGIAPEAAELLKRHVFYRQGKIQEIEVT